MDELIEFLLKLILIIALLAVLIIPICTIVLADDYTGQDLLCDKMDYLSTNCMKAKVIPMAYKDKEVAMEEAKSEKSYTTNYVTNTKNVINQVPPVSDGVTVTSKMEYATDDFKYYANGYKAEEYKK